MKDGTLAFRSPYDPGLIAALKAKVPYSDRRPVYDGKRFDYWAIAPQYAQTLADLAEQYLGQRPQVPAVQSRVQFETRLLDVRYIGAAKERQGGQKTASGWCNGGNGAGWNAIFPEAVLKEWFAIDPDKPEEQTTLYAALGARQTATAKEITKAYLAAARQWHPDVCKEPGGEEQFKRINEAYQVLSNPLQRRKYDAGLTLAASVGKHQCLDSQMFQVSNVWRPPLRCGYILCEGVEQLGRFVAAEILQWEDIINGQGETLVTSWPPGGDHFEERWV
jgi:DnaJ-domain-containing protein 1